MPQRRIPRRYKQKLKVIVSSCYNGRGSKHHHLLAETILAKFCPHCRSILSGLEMPLLRFSTRAKALASAATSSTRFKSTKSRAPLAFALDIVRVTHWQRQQRPFFYFSRCCQVGRRASSRRLGYSLGKKSFGFFARRKSTGNVCRRLHASSSLGTVT